MRLISFVIFAFTGLGLVSPIAEENKHSFIGILRKEGEFMCAAVIIGTNIAATSAVCAEKLTDEFGITLETELTLTAGILERKIPNIEEDEKEDICFQSKRIAKVVKHPEFGKRRDYDYDVALVFLDNDLEINECVNPIKLCDGECIGKVYIVGWGIDISQNEVSELVIGCSKVQLQDVCEKAFEQEKKLTDTMGCAVSEVHPEICHDSGSSVVLYSDENQEERFLVGIILPINPDECGFAKPILFTKVSVLQDWISQNDEEK